MNKILSTSLTIAALAAFGMALPGCNPPRTINSVSISEDGQYDWLQTDPNLSQVANLSRVVKTRTGDLLRVQVDVTNLTNERRDIHYRIVWFDANGIEVVTPLTNWQKKVMSGQQTVSIGGVAPDSSVTNCRMELRRAEGY
jgi:uncharacterized protein YcfL